MAWLPEDRVERLNLAEADLRKALRLRAGSAAAHAALGVLYMNRGRAELGIIECERALALDRNLATAHAWIGMGKYYSGRGDETERHILQARRLRQRLDDLRRLREIRRGQGRGGGRLGEPLDRRQP